MWQMLVILPLAVFVLSGVLLLYALRGRRVNDHPICRRCGFDLYGKPEGVTVCSECGIDLRHKGAVRIGRRVVRRRLLSISLPLLVLCAGWIGLLGWGAARGVKWNHHKPAWLLMRESRGTDTATRDAALTELIRRMGDGKLPQWRTDALVDAALEIQGDPRRPWSDAVGDAIAKARDVGKLPEAKWQRYVGQAAALELRARAVVRRGEPLVFWPHIKTGRVARGHVFWLNYKVLDIRLGDASVISPTWRGDGTAMHQGESSALEPGEPWGMRIHVPPVNDALLALPDGPQTLRVTVRVRLQHHKNENDIYPVIALDEPRELAAPVAIVPADAVTVTVNRDESLRPAVEKALKAGQSNPNLSSTNIGLDIAADRPPVDLAYTVLLRRAGKEWEMEDVWWYAGRRGIQFLVIRDMMEMPGFYAELNGEAFPPEQADVVLRPSMRQAVRTLDMTQIWGGEVVIKDVNLRARLPANRGFPIRRRPAPAAQSITQPTTRPG